MFIYLGGEQYINTDAVEIVHIQLLGNKIAIITMLNFSCEINNYIIEFNNQDLAKEQLSHILRQLNSLAREKAERQ